MRGVVGLLLFGAGVLKAAQLIAEPALALAIPVGQFLVPLQIAVELGIGVLILSGLYWRQLRWAALMLFTTFAVYSFYLATNGATTCGCFGAIEVHPWWTFALDAVVVTGLLLSILGRTSPPTLIVSNWQVAFTFTLVALSIVGAIALGWFATPPAASLTAVGDLIVLEPEDWIGMPLPIAEYLDADLSKGDWVILLHRHDCPECQEAAPRYEELAATQKIALIEMPPYGGDPASHGTALHARLPDDREWFVQTPVEIRLDDGVVVSATTELPALVKADKL